MGRKNKYETNIKPHLKEIRELAANLTEYQIARKFGVTPQSLESYKKNYPELLEALRDGKKDLVNELKMTLIKKAKGFTYTESKQILREEGGKKIKVVEKYEKYAQPDTGAIHLLLKNLDDSWRNDDKETIDQKRKQLELAERKVDQNEW